MPLARLMRLLGKKNCVRIIDFVTKKLKLAQQIFCFQTLTTSLLTPFFHHFFSSSFHSFSSQEYLETCMNDLENLFEQHRRLCYSVTITAQNIPQSVSNGNSCSSSITATTSNTSTNSIVSNSNSSVTSDSSDESDSESNSSADSVLNLTPTQQKTIEISNKSQSGTPTDVQDVTFQSCKAKEGVPSEWPPARTENKESTLLDN